MQKIRDYVSTNDAKDENTHEILCNDYNDDMNTGKNNKIKKYMCKLSKLNNYKYTGSYKKPYDYYDYYLGDRKFDFETLTYDNVNKTTTEKKNIIKNIIFWSIERLIGVKYKWIYYDDRTDKYKNTNAFHKNDMPIPYYSQIYDQGMNCIGLINLIYRIIFKSVPYITYKYSIYKEFETIGSLHQFIEYLKYYNKCTPIKYDKNDISTVEEFKRMPIGTLFIYTPNSGHVALYIGNGYVLHSWANNDSLSDKLENPGVTISTIEAMIYWLEESNKNTNHKYYYSVPDEWLFGEASK